MWYPASADRRDGTYHCYSVEERWQISLLVGEMVYITTSEETSENMRDSTYHMGCVFLMIFIVGVKFYQGHLIITWTGNHNKFMSLSSLS